MKKDLKRVTPESEGISSGMISELLEDIKEKKLDVHGIIIMRHGNILAEGYCEPFHQDFPHRVYSCSKTFVALAVGKLIGEGKINLKDKIIDFFPEYCEICDKENANMSVEDALTMQVSLPATTTYSDRKNGVIYPKPSGWDKSAFAAKAELPNGMLFQYNTTANYLLNVIVEKVTGQLFLDYLRPEFDEMGISKEIDCVKSPDGYSWGGSGIVCTLRDLAKVGQIVMSHGNCNGKQLFPYDYMVRATSKLTENSFNGVRTYNTCGYGYQIWMEPLGYGMHGMLGQMVHCFPGKDLLIAYQSTFLGDASAVGYHLIYNCMSRIYKKIGDASLQEDEKAYSKLIHELSDLSLGKGYGAAHSKLEEKVHNKKYILEENPMGMKWVSFSFHDQNGIFTYENSRGVKEIPFGYEEYMIFEMPEQYYGMNIGTMMEKGYNSICLGSWVDDHSILLKLNIIDIYMGGVIVYCNFKEDKIVLSMNKSTEYYMYDYQGIAVGTAVIR